jgi:NAD(P)-dependent dehydrogenase (short-subunit alcohol dehydrogenase family)
MKEKVVVITGSSQGIGKAIAQRFLGEGAYVVLNGRNKERLDATLGAFQKEYTHLHAICCDVSIPEGGRQLIEETIEKFGRIDVLINNAGVSMRGNVSELNPVVFQQLFDSNVHGSVNPTIPAIPYLRETKGSIVFISSLAGIRGLPGLSAYSSAKMALRAIAESIRIEEKKHGIHVGLIYVGMTAIEHNKETIASDGSKQVLASREGKKVQSTEEVANAVWKNIRNRKFTTVLTPLGKINAFLQARFPMLVEKIILQNLDKFEENSK